MTSSNACWSFFFKTRGSLLLAMWAGLAAPARVLAQVDSLAVRSPGKALRRAIVPGWGQLYNRQYRKVPVVYAGLGAFAGGVYWAHGQYQLYRHAYLFTARTHEDGTPVFPEYAADYARLLVRLDLAPESQLTPEEVVARRAYLEPQLRARRDNLRRSRDQLILGFVLWYGLSMLDAYVSAHLSDFDVGEDLALRLRPAPATLSLRWTF